MPKVTEQTVKDAKIRMDNAYAEYEQSPEDSALYDDYAELAADYFELKAKLDERSCLS